jgi:hypothetical protein
MWCGVAFVGTDIWEELISSIIGENQQARNNISGN